MKQFRTISQATNFMNLTIGQKPNVVYVDHNYNIIDHQAELYCAYLSGQKSLVNKKNEFRKWLNKT